MLNLQNTKSNETLTTKDCDTVEDFLKKAITIDVDHRTKDLVDAIRLFDQLIPIVERTPTTINHNQLLDKRCDLVRELVDLISSQIWFDGDFSLPT